MSSLRRTNQSFARKPKRCHVLALGALVFMPTSAHASFCDTERPNWDGSPATQLDEAITLFMAPTGLFLIGATAVAVLFRHAIGAGIACVMWAFYVTAIIMRGDPAYMMAAMEGCIGQPTLFVALAAAICLSAVIYTMRREKRL
ncbi:hypothetical protein ACS3SW_15140 [Roseobacteraceae bacterium S113]